MGNAGDCSLHNPRITHSTVIGRRRGLSVVWFAALAVKYSGNSSIVNMKKIIHSAMEQRTQNSPLLSEAHAPPV